MTKPRTNSGPNLGAITRAIAELQQVDLRNADVEELKDRLKAMIDGHRTSTPIVGPGQIVHRGVRLRPEEKPMLRSRLSYRPAHLPGTWGRAARPGDTVFYCSVGRDGVPYELGLLPGDHVAIGRWRFAAPVIVNNAGYSRNAFKSLASPREVPSWATAHAKELSEVDRVIAGFFAKVFCKVVHNGEEYLYKTSVAIAEALYRCDLTIEGTVAGYDGLPRWGGLLYPSVALAATGDNLALLPEIVDECMCLDFVEWARVDSLEERVAYKVTLLDCATSFGPEGAIEWKGRPPQLAVPPGGTWSVIDGHAIARDANGQLVEPS